MKKDIMSAAFVAIFLLMSLIPFLGMVIFGPGPAMANESPVSAPSLTDERGANFAVLADARDYVNYGFFTRAEFITLGRRLSAGLFGATDSELVTTGRDGWLFYTETMEDYAGVNGLTDREIFAAAENIRLMDEYCDDRDMDFLFALVPNKITLYPEYSRVSQRAETNDAGKLYDYLNEMDVRSLDLTGAFKEKDEVLYFAHDSHWTSRGAALAADAMIGELGRESRFFDGDFVPTEHSGDLFEMLYPALDDGETDLKPVEVPEFDYGEGGTRADSITINTTSHGNGSLLCYRDSFGNDLYPYMAASFGEARFSRDPSYDMCLAEKLGADTVIVELVERNIDYILDHPPVVRAPERDVKLPDGSAGTMRVYAANAEEPGWATVSGSLPGEPDTDSPVYVTNGDGVYEAVLTRDGFTVLLPTGKGPWRVAFFVDGKLAVYDMQ